MLRFNVGDKVRLSHLAKTADKRLYGQTYRIIRVGFINGQGEKWDYLAEHVGTGAQITFADWALFKPDWEDALKSRSVS